MCMGMFVFLHACIPMENMLEIILFRFVVCNIYMNKAANWVNPIHTEIDSNSTFPGQFNWPQNIPI